MNFAKIVIASINCGLTMDEIDRSDIGFLFDLITTKNNIYLEQIKKKESDKKPKVKVRWATQEDFDRL